MSRASALDLKTSTTAAYNLYLSAVYQAHRLITENPTTLEHDAIEMRRVVKEHWAQFLCTPGADDFYQASVRPRTANPKRKPT